jgi:hypothetical protein
MGPMSGRGAGYCAGFGVPGFANPMPGRGFGMGFGRGRGGGRGWRHWYYATGLPGWQRFGAGIGPYQQPPDPALQKQALQSQATALQRALDEIKQRLDALESDAAETP